MHLKIIVYSKSDPTGFFKLLLQHLKSGWQFLWACVVSASADGIGFADNSQYG